MALDLLTAKGKLEALSAALLIKGPLNGGIDSTQEQAIHDIIQKAYNDNTGLSWDFVNLSEDYNPVYQGLMYVAEVSSGLEGDVDQIQYNQFQSYIRDHLSSSDIGLSTEAYRAYIAVLDGQSDQINAENYDAADYTKEQIKAGDIIPDLPEKADPFAALKTDIVGGAVVAATTGAFVGFTAPVLVPAFIVGVIVTEKADKAVDKIKSFFGFGNATK